MRFDLGVVLLGLTAVSLAIPDANLHKHDGAGLEKRMKKSGRVTEGLDDLAAKMEAMRIKAEQDKNKKRPAGDSSSNDNKKPKKDDETDDE